MTTNLRAQTLSICEELGLDPSYVKSLTITPNTAHVEVFKRADADHKYVTSEGEPATETHDFAITTRP